ncbi:hypothetical protein TNCV_408301 [Trichonephila clavipes]|nr:hypothetical protein TNCV_408301 [Trichonephila clavipes]
MADHFSSWNEGLPETDKSAGTVTKGVISIWISLLGTPQHILHLTKKGNLKVIPSAIELVNRKSETVFHSKGHKEAEERSSEDDLPP